MPIFRFTLFTLALPLAWLPFFFPFFTNDGGPSETNRGSKKRSYRQLERAISSSLPVDARFAPFSVLPFRFVSPETSLFSSLVIGSAFCLAFTTSTTTSSFSGSGGGGGGGGGLAKLRKTRDGGKKEEEEEGKEEEEEEEEEKNEEEVHRELVFAYDISRESSNQRVVRRVSSR